MNTETKDLINALYNCTFLPGSWDKRFIKSLKSLVYDNKDLSEKQLIALGMMKQKYRKQLSSLEK